MPDRGGEAGPGAASAHTRTIPWLCRAGVQAVTARRSCACGSPRGLSPCARRVQDSSAEHSRGHRRPCGSGQCCNRLLVLASALSGPLGQSATQGDRNVGARASGSVNGRVFCVACAPAQVGRSCPAVTVPMGPRTWSPGFRVPGLGCALVQISCTANRLPRGSIGSRGALFGGSNGTFEGPLLGAGPRHHSWTPFLLHQLRKET